MKKVKAIAVRNLPVKLPFRDVAILYLFWDRFQGQPQWLFGILWFLLAMSFALGIAAMWYQESVDIFGDD